MPKIQLLPDIREEGPTTGGDSHIVIVYDNEYNTFPQVENILIQATGCSRKEAQIETWEVHNLGKSVVHHATEEECHRIAAIIRTIGIRVEVCEE